MGSIQTGSFKAGEFLDHNTVASNRQQMQEERSELLNRVKAREDRATCRGGSMGPGTHPGYPGSTRGSRGQSQLNLFKIINVGIAMP